MLVTLCKIGNHCVVDPSAEEEKCSVASLVVGISCISENDGMITTMRTCGAGSLRIETVNESLEMSVRAAICLNTELIRILRHDEGKSKTDNVGFLK